MCWTVRRPTVRCFLILHRRLIAHHILLVYTPRNSSIQPSYCGKSWQGFRPCTWHGPIPPRLCFIIQRPPQPLSSVAAPNHDNPSPRLTDIPPTLAATGHRPTASRMAAASPDTRRQGGRTSAAMPTPHRTGGTDDESGGQMGKHMQVRRANDAELRRGFRFQRIVCAETGTWRGRGAWKRRGWAMEDEGWIFASFAFAFFVGFVSIVSSVYNCICDKVRASGCILRRWQRRWRQSGRRSRAGRGSTW